LNIQHATGNLHAGALGSHEVICYQVTRYVNVTAGHVDTTTIEAVGCRSQIAGRIDGAPRTRPQTPPVTAARIRDGYAGRGEINGRTGTVGEQN
jgi:hypothetical protein